MRAKAQRGFTLIELLIIIGIIGFLAAAILVAVDPVKRIQDARNAKRWSEVNAMLNAILTKQVDDRGLYAGETGAPLITGPDAQIVVYDETNVVCDAATTRPSCNAPGLTFDDVTGGTECVVNLSALSPDYLAEIPLDPIGAGANPCPDGTGCTFDGDMALGTTAAAPSTGYYVHRTTGNRLEFGSCFPDQGETISVKR